MLRTSCSGLGTQVTPNASLRQLKKSRMAVSQCKAVEELTEELCISSQPSLPTRIPYFFNCFRSAYCHALCASDVFHSFVPQSLQTHFTTCACTASGRPKYFAGGKWWPACAHCSCAPCSSPAPPATPVRWLGRARYSQRFTFNRSSSVINVS